MNKKIVLGVVGVALVLGSSYFVCGQVIQKTYHHAVAQLNTNREIKVSVLNYSSGIFSSSAILEVALDNGTKNNAKKISLRQHISHGPIVMFNTAQGFKINFAAAVVTTTPDEATIAELIKDTADSTPFNLKTLIRFNNEAYTWLKLTGVTDEHIKDALSWSTITGELQHDLNFNSYKGSINIPKITRNSSNSSLTLADLMIFFDASRQEQGSFHNNVIQAKTISFSKQDQEELKIESLSAKLDFKQDAAQHLAINLAVEIPAAQILAAHFANDVAHMQMMHINAINVPKLGLYNSLTLKSAIDIAQQITSAKETTMQLELPKSFTNAFLSYISFELYRGSILGKFDKRPDPDIRQDINASVNNLITSVLRQKLFIDDGKYYALNFEGISRG